jgi:hypothetical protein
MTSLPAWVVLSLPTALDTQQLIDRAKELGVHVESTRDGLQFPGGFLGRIDPRPFPARLLDRSITRGELQLGPTNLVLSGGTNELARNEHQQPAALREAVRQSAAQTAALVGLPDLGGPLESAASRKVSALTALVRALTPLASVVILPRANHLATPAKEFAERADEFLSEAGYHFPLWAYLKLRDDADCPLLESNGMWVYGLPDVAMPLPEGVEQAVVVRVLGALQRELVAEGAWPESGTHLQTELGEVTLERCWDGLFAWPAVWQKTPAIRRAQARFARRRALSLLIGEHTLHHIGAEQDGVAIEHFLRANNDSGIAVTNGLSDQPQLGSHEGDENDFVELTVTSSQLGPWANGWLEWMLSCYRGHDETRPIRPRDRLVLPAPTQGIAGCIVWPMGHLAPETPDAPTVRLWDLIPFTESELADFRAGPHVQRLWMEERVTRRDIPLIQRRFLPQQTA